MREKFLCVTHTNHLNQTKITSLRVITPKMQFKGPVYYKYINKLIHRLEEARNMCNHMFLNPSKCKFLLISRKRNRMNNPPAITINGQMLETVPTFKYLGLLLTSDLSWLKEYAPRQRKSWGFYTADFTNMLIQRLLYIHCTAPHGVRSTSLGSTLKKRSGST